MKNKISRIDWDFTGIDDLALPPATLYEYARTSNKLRPAIIKWLLTKIDGHTVGEHLLLGLQGKCKPSPATRVQITRLGQAATGNFELLSVLKMRPDFPSPWLSLKMSYRKNPNYRSIQFTPTWITAGAIGEALRSGDSIEEIVDGERSSGSYELYINWGDSPTVDQIVADFEKWVRREAKQHPEMNRRGKPAQPQMAPLAWLSAYRLNQAGFTFPVAQAMLQRHGASARCHPFYADKSGWSDAISNAKKKLSRLESGNV